MINKSLKKQALELNENERANLAHILIDSLNPDIDYESEEAWAEELKRRIRQFKEGKSLTKSWSEVKHNAQDIVG